jgi:hypothetical protein
MKRSLILSPRPCAFGSGVFYFLQLNKVHLFQKIIIENVVYCYYYYYFNGLIFYMSLLADEKGPKKSYLHIKCKSYEGLLTPKVL